MSEPVPESEPSSQLYKKKIKWLGKNLKIVVIAVGLILLLLIALLLGIFLSQRTGLECKPNRNAEAVRLEQVARGYDIGLSSAFKGRKDEGIMTGRVFNHSCSSCSQDTAEEGKSCAKGYFNYLEVKKDLDCNGAMSIEFVRTYEDYLAIQGSSVSLDSPAAGSIERALELGSDGSSSADPDVRSVWRFFEDNQGEMAVVKMKCRTHTFTMNTHRPYFAQGFINSLRQLNNSSSQDRTNAYELFVRKYGTHYVRSAEFGASAMFLVSFESRSPSENVTEGRQACLESMAAAGCAQGNNTCLEYTLKLCFLRSGQISQINFIRDIREVSRGSLPENLTNWANEDFTPVPIQVHLAPYSELITEENLEQGEEYGLGEKLGAAGIRGLLDHGNEQYCELIMGHSKHECRPLNSVCGVDNDCAPGTVCELSPTSGKGYICRAKEVMLIVGGNATNSPEILSQYDQRIRCNISIAPLPVKNAQLGTFFKHKNQPVFCSAYNGSPCYKYSASSNSWERFKQLTKRRYAPAKVEFDDFILITGGWDGQNILSSTDEWIPSQEAFISSFHLPSPVVAHCITTLNETHALLTGGIGAQDVYSNKAYLFTKATGQWTQIRSMRAKRAFHACGLAGDSKVLVVGGSDRSPNIAPQVEIYDLSTRKWSSGPDFPKRIVSATTVQHEDTFLIIGGNSANGLLDTVYEYNIHNNTWDLRKNQKLGLARQGAHALGKFPASYFGCT